MIKKYRYNRDLNTAAFTLTDKGGNSQRFVFEKGNVQTKKQPELTLCSTYSQNLLESSEYFKMGIVKLEKVFEGGEEEVKPQYTPIEEVKLAQEAISYVADNWEIRVTNAKDAEATANKHGFTFPNLKVKG
jgi:hypothetical protein